jgi:hypothetical protein
MNADNIGAIASYIILGITVLSFAIIGIIRAIKGDD